MCPLMRSPGSSNTGLSALAALALLTGACAEAEPPATFRVLEMSGSPYERGVQHGQRFPSEIRSLYTQMLTASTLPYLNREQPDIAEVLGEYAKPLYDDGQFSYQLLLQSAQSMEREIPDDLVEEMQGVADGAGLPYEQILLLNTFLDSMLAMRAITFFIRGTESPTLLSVRFDGPLESDGADNDGDGEIDEQAEGFLDPYGSSPHASLVEVPTDASVRFVLVDQAGAAAALGLDDSRQPEGVDPASIRIQLDTEVFEAGGTAITSRPVTTARGEGLEVTFTPPRGFPPASVVSLLLGAGDLSVVTDPPPAHARLMRDERIVLTTAGFGAEGLSYGIFPSDTLDNGMVVDIVTHLSNLERARLIGVGTPIGMLARTVLNQAHNVEEATEILRTARRTFGWNMLLADGDAEIRAVEMDSGILGDGGFSTYGPSSDGSSTDGSSVGPDDLRLASHFVANADDIDFAPLRPQRTWSSFYFRSLRALSHLGDRIGDGLGRLDVESAVAIMRDPVIVDPRDSMSAVVFEPAARRLHVAMGEVPATDGLFRPFDLADFFGPGASR